MEASAITRRFGTVQALDTVSLTLRGSRVHCLLGGNGAGKSTLVSVLSGATRPTSGELCLYGQPLRLESPKAARQAGIAVVYQQLALVPLMSVWRNFVLAAEPVGRMGRLDSARARASTLAALNAFEITLDIERPIANLSGGERQIVAIARAVHYGARVLVLDEPTAALAVDQVSRVFAAVHAARSRGAAILLVTHNPQQALEIGDDITVLQRGRVAASRSAGAFSLAELYDSIAS